MGYVAYKWLPRGYTGHEHLLEMDLINMNARLYDPTLARMLAPDNMVGDPTNTQAYNRYSYVWNNPLKYTDPSGNDLVSALAGVITVGVRAVPFLLQTGTQVASTAINVGIAVVNAQAATTTSVSITNNTQQAMAKKVVVIYSRIVDTPNDPHRNWVEVVEATTQNGKTTKVNSYVDFYGKEDEGLGEGSPRFNEIVGQMKTYGRKNNESKTKKQLEQMKSAMSKMQLSSAVPLAPLAGAGYSTLAAMATIFGIDVSYGGIFNTVSDKLQPPNSVVHSVQMFNEYGNTVYDSMTQNSDYAKQRSETLDMYGGVFKVVQYGVDFIASLFW